MATIYRYAELRPDQLSHRLEVVPVAIVPWGALEWHGPHLPFGLDGLVAEGFSQELAARTGAVLLPTTYLPITALPHPQSISIRTEVVRGAWHDLLRELGRAGFRVVCIVSGHYAQGHEIVLAEVADQVSQGGGPLALAGTPLALLQDPGLLDHAGKWETSQLMHYRPELVDLTVLAPGSLPPVRQVAVLGDDPRTASAEQGQAVVERALQSWETWIERLLGGQSLEALHDLYSGRMASYQAYLDRFYQGSWEAAIEAWWKERTG
ncbi:MAG: creatininase family protein [Anaerolineales bacterium]